MRGRQDILELYLQDKPLADDVDVKAIARGTPGFNGAGKWCTVLLTFQIVILFTTSIISLTSRYTIFLGMITFKIKCHGLEC